MKVFSIFPILLLLTCRVLAKDKANTRGKYTVGVYVLCDEPMTKQLQGRSKEEYFGAFFSVINLIFQQLPSSIPMVKFEVVKIETESELKALKQAYQYLPSSQKTNLYGLWPQHINLTGGQVADTPTTKQLSEYFKVAGEPYNNSHVIVLFSGRTLLLYRVYHDYGNTKAGGNHLAVHTNPKREGICTDQNIVITQDDGFYSGTMYTARRLARLLGANYDYAKNTTCLYSSSMLMGDMDKKENYNMSPCTIQDLKKSLESNKKQCLEKRFNSTVASTGNFPANLFNTDSYCAHKFKGQENAGECTQTKWDISGYPSAGPCQVRCCYGTIRGWKRNMFSMYTVSALYGYPCNANGVQNGVCVKEVCVKKPS